MDDLKFREMSLDAALRTATVGDDHDDILNRARDYYQYLSGKSPDHRPAAKAGSVTAQRIETRRAATTKIGAVRSMRAGSRSDAPILGMSTTGKD